MEEELKRKGIRSLEKLEMKGWKRREKKDQRGITCAETGFCEGGGGRQTRNMAMFGSWSSRYNILQ